MRYTFIYLLIYLFIVTLSGCGKKDNSDNSSGNITVQSLSGTYALKALIWVSPTETVNVYDSLDACEKDNLLKLNADNTLNFEDAGLACSPPENGNGTWDLKGDSLYFIPGTTSRIQSFDGKILILTGTPPNEPGVNATTTFEKQ